MKNSLKTILATVALAVPMMLVVAPATTAAVPAENVAGPARAVAMDYWPPVRGTFSCSRGITTQIYAYNSTYHYHEVNNDGYYFWYPPSWTTVNWNATNGYWYLETDGRNFYYRVYCR